jgi:hypothetical protein
MIKDNGSPKQSWERRNKPDLSYSLFSRYIEKATAITIGW